MHALLAAAAFVAANWETIAAALVGLMSFVGTLKAAFSKHPKVEGALDKTLDVLSFLARAGANGVPMLGRLSLPGLPSHSAEASKSPLALVPPDKEQP